MKLFVRSVAFFRSLVLIRELRAVERSVDALSSLDRRMLASLALRDLANASKCEHPHLYGTPSADARYLAWGTATRTGFERIKSDNPHIKLRGLALWLAVAFHETKDSRFGELQFLHRKLMRQLRLLKESLPSSEGNSVDAAQAQAA